MSNLSSIQNSVRSAYSSFTPSQRFLANTTGIMPFLNYTPSGGTLAGGAPAQNQDPALARSPAPSRPSVAGNNRYALMRSGTIAGGNIDYSGTKLGT